MQLRTLMMNWLGSKFIEIGNVLAPNPNNANIVQTQYLNTIVQQNWIIIRMLDDLLHK